MKAIHGATMALLAVIIAGCAGMDTAPTPEARSALAPTGKLRVGFVAGSIHATKDPASGEFKGVAIDLGKELARRAGVPFEPAPFPSVAAVMAAAKAGEWDVAVSGINAERALVMDFSPPYMVVEFSYLVAPGFSASAVADIDKAGVRIGVLERGSPDNYLSGVIRNATIVRAPTIAAFVELLRARQIDALFGTKTFLLNQAEKTEGARVLEGRVGGEDTALATPKGRDLGAAYVRQFVENAKAEGLVKAAIERAGMRGVVVAPPK